MHPRARPVDSRALSSSEVVAEFVPNEMRRTITAGYFLITGLLSNGFGPLAVGLATDYLFHDKASIGRSLSLTSFATGVPAAVLLILGLKAFRRSMARATWAGANSTQVPVAGLSH